MLSLVDGLLLLVLAEGLVLWLWHRRTGRGLAPHAFLPNLLAGALLMLALRCALTPGLGWAVLLSLGGAGIGHLLDLHGRLRAGKAAPTSR